MPPSLVLYDADGKAIYTIKKSAVEEVEKLHFIVPEFTSYVNKDGVELPAIMVKPYNFESGKKYPVILYVYGGPGAQQVIDVWSGRHLWSNILAREGYFVVTLELRAGLNSSKVDENTQYKRAYGIPNLNDILSAVEWLSGFSFIDKERIGIWGWSGGGSTTLFALTHSNVFKAGIAVAPVSDLKFYDTIYMERYMSTPDDNADGYEETSSVAAAENLKAKLLIVHGTYDDNVHPQNTFAFIDKLIDKNIQFELMIYPWRQHGIYDTPARIHLYTMMLNFWKKYL
jgi:dipeptidyl-peptidase-4